jgi:hypothetical protein
MADTPLDRAKDAVDETAAHAQATLDSAEQAREEIKELEADAGHDVTGTSGEDSADAGIDVGGGGGGSGGGTTDD